MMKKAFNVINKTKKKTIMWTIVWLITILVLFFASMFFVNDVDNIAYINEESFAQRGGFVKFTYSLGKTNEEYNNIINDFAKFAEKNKVDLQHDLVVDPVCYSQFNLPNNENGYGQRLYLKVVLPIGKDINKTDIYLSASDKAIYEKINGTTLNIGDPVEVEHYANIWDNGNLLVSKVVYKYVGEATQTTIYANSYNIEEINPFKEKFYISYNFSNDLKYDEVIANCENIADKAKTSLNGDYYIDIASNNNENTPTTILSSFILAFISALIIVLLTCLTVNSIKKGIKENKYFANFNHKELATVSAINIALIVFVAILISSLIAIAFLPVFNIGLSYHYESLLNNLNIEPIISYPIYIPFVYLGATAIVLLAKYGIDNIKYKKQENKKQDETLQ